MDKVITIKIKDIQNLPENERVHFWRCVNSWKLELYHHLIEAEKLSRMVNESRKITREHLDFKPDDFSRR